MPVSAVTSRSSISVSIVAAETGSTARASPVASDVTTNLRREKSHLVFAMSSPARFQLFQSLAVSLLGRCQVHGAPQCGHCRRAVATTGLCCPQHVVVFRRGFAIDRLAGKRGGLRRVAVRLEQYLAKQAGGRSIIGSERAGPAQRGFRHIESP